MPTETLTQRYIRDRGLPALMDTFKIRARRHGEFANLVHLKYSQIESPMDEPIVQECRGLILDEADGWRLVSYPFKKFFNAGEPLAVPIDWSTARVQEKLDGSLMVLYWYASAWRVASNGTPDAAGPVLGTTGTFADLFWNTWKSHGWRLPDGPATACYMFEMMTPFNRIVVQHDAARLVCIGGRQIDSLQELSPTQCAEAFGWQAVKSFPLATIDECMSAAAVLDPIQSEGYVVVDADFNRVKIKSPRYVAIAHAKDGCSPRRLLELVRANESAEYLAYFPELKAAYDAVDHRFTDVCAEADRQYETVRGIADQRAFAAAVLKLSHASALFSIRSGKHPNARSFYSTCTTTALERAVDLDSLAGVPMPAGE